MTETVPDAPIFAAEPFIGHRLRVRRIYEDIITRNVSREARKNREWIFFATHGGSVANSYGYPASTEGIVVISNPYGVTVYFCARLPANKVTLSGVAAACVGDSLRPIWDDRFGETKTAEAEEEAKRVFMRHVPPLYVLATVISQPDPQGSC